MQPPSVRHSRRRSGPAARWIAPSTPPPPSSVELAALTIASTARPVISARAAWSFAFAAALIAFLLLGCSFRPRGARRNRLQRLKRRRALPRQGRLTSGLEADDRAVCRVREQIEQAVRSLPDLANAAEAPQHPFLAHDFLAVEPQPHEQLVAQRADEEIAAPGREPVAGVE